MPNRIDVFSRLPCEISDDVYVFSSMDGDHDYWASETEHLHIDDRITEFLPDHRYELALEVGAGNGRSTVPLSKLSGKLYALESSKIGIDRLKSRGLSNVINVLSYDIKLPFKDNMFDLVASVTVIEHIPANFAIEFLSEHYRVLKPGGILLIRNDAWFYGVLERWGYFDKENPDPTHINMITPKKLQKQLESLGFIIEAKAYFPFYRFIKGKLPLMDVLATKGNFICRKPYER
ncbi:MAG TPA: class I SAM-dependent methyltransferase [Saprospiraceae bacterium]|nr:class I SAM-dependent methyltransferase [Saprospiraceae bacterium]